MKTNHKGFTHATAGFTVLEFLIVLAIIILLIAIVLPALGASREKSVDEKKVTDLKTAALGVEQYYQICGAYPESITTNIQCDALGTNTLADLIPNIQSYKFNDGNSGFYYTPIALDTTNPDECNGFHMGVELKNKTEGTFANGDSDIDSGAYTICQAFGVSSNRIDGTQDNMFDIFR